MIVYHRMINAGSKRMRKSLRKQPRRQFVNSILAGASALALKPALPVTASPAAKNMTLGFSTYGSRGIATEDVIPLLSKTGYDAVEITCTKGFDAAPENVSTERRQVIHKALHETGLRLTSIMEHTTPAASQQVNDANLTRIQKAAEFVSDITDTQKVVIQTVLGGGSWDDKKNLFVEQVGRWVDKTSGSKTRICIKPHRGGGMDTPEKALWIMEQLDNPKRLRMVYDYSHYIYTGLDLVPTIKEAAAKTAHVAVKDTVKQDDGGFRFELPGTAGTINFSTLIRQFYDLGYRGDISCEVSGMVWGKPDYDPRSAIKICYENISKAFERAGVPRPAGNR